MRLVMLLMGMLALDQVAHAAKPTTLSDLKPGRKFEVLEDLSFPVPELLRMIGEIPLLQVTAKSIGVARQTQTAEPVCLITGIVLSSDVPAQVSFSKGSTVEVKTVEADKKLNPLFAGPSVAFSVQATGSPLKAKLRCFPGKNSKDPMSIESLEQVFRRKVKLKT